MKNNSILLNRIFPTSGMSLTLIRNLIFILFGSILLTVSAKVQVPFWPVPMTMQTFVVFLIGMVYGMETYLFLLFWHILVEGAIGLPVFATGGGIMLLNWTYMLAIFMACYLASILIGKLSEKGFSNSYVKSLIALLFGSIIIFLLGVGIS